MLYVFLLYTDPDRPQLPDVMERHFALADEARERHAYVASEALGSTQNATTLRVRDGKTLITDGPFAETKEVLGGLYILDCKDLDDALEYAAKIPDAWSGSVEVRPIVGVEGWEYTLPGERRPM